MCLVNELGNCLCIENKLGNCLCLGHELGNYLSLGHELANWTNKKEKRTHSKLLEKTNYKENKKRELEDQESKFKYTHPAKKRKKGQQHETKADGDNNKKKVKAVMFVPYTKHSELASRLIEGEEQMEKMTGYKLKIVEKGGTKLVDILHKANPWAGEEEVDACFAEQRRKRTRRTPRIVGKEIACTKLAA